jgi:hypothetical protein
LFYSEILKVSVLDPLIHAVNILAVLDPLIHAETMNTTIDDLAATLNGHQMTDDQGQLLGEGETLNSATATEELEVEEQTNEEESTQAEKPEVEVSNPQENAKPTENELVEDDSGKRYVPEKRYKETYAKMKNYERELASRQQQAKPANDQDVPIDRTIALEIELLRDRYPQFDPESKDYSSTLDEMGAEILRANPTITRIEAARRAINRAKELTEPYIVVKGDNQNLKKMSSDNGMQSRASRGAEQPQVDVNSMSISEMEAYLKKTGNW